MAISIPVLVLSLVLVFQPCTEANDLLAPILSPIFEDVCKQVKCGQGICKPSDNSSLIPFECECSPGWKQLASSDTDPGLKFMPCVIPNCTLNYSCSEAPPPVQAKDNQGNESIFDVCRWTDCGGGKCQTLSPFTHKCECNEGYHNLLNLTFSPCFKECSLGMDCKNLGIGLTNGSSPPPSLSADNSNQANIGIEGGLVLLMFLLALFAF
ncbi:uncharacterized protein [Rutidosis leptorrhynchoides]|uniref:uncharacterized protein n=1 Tax=Rutidosis leptorrhynchoides TaxID=125765 RepID=UPI003A992743